MCYIYISKYYYKNMVRLWAYSKKKVTCSTNILISKVQTNQRNYHSTTSQFE
jgi:hypothetical protein